MSYAVEMSNNLLYQGYISAEIWAILGGYKQGTFNHENLTESDISVLNLGKNLIINTLNDIERLEKKIIDIRSPDMPVLNLELIVSVVPSRNPSELKKELCDYRELLESIANKRVLEKNNMEKTCSFFAKIAEKADDEAAKWYVQEDDE